MTKKEETTCLILTSLLGLGKASKWQLHDELKDQIGSRTTLGKRVNDLRKEELVKIKKGTRGPVGTHYCFLSLKGLVYLILKCKLSDDDLKKALKKLFSHKKFDPTKIMIKQPLYVDFLTEITIKSIQELRPKISLEFFNEEYVVSLLLDIFEKNMWGSHEKIKDSIQFYSKFQRQLGIDERAANMNIFRERIKKAQASRNLLKHQIKAYKAIIQNTKTGR